MSEYTTRLVTREIGDLSDAAKYFGEVQIVGREKIVPLIIVPSRDCCKWWLTIPEGMHALVQSNGRFIGIWKAGFNYAEPWTRVSHLVTKQYIVYDVPVKECPTLDNVMVEIDVSLVFHIKDDEESVKNFVYHLGPERLEGMLKAFQEEAVRTMARKKTYYNIFDLMDTEDYDEDGNPIERKKDGTGVPRDPRGGVEMTEMSKPNMETKEGAADILDHQEQLENTKRTMNERLADYGVEVYSITITNVTLPNNFAREMEQATTFESKNKYASIEQKYNLTVITDEERKRQLTQRLSEERAQKETEALEQQAGEKKKLKAIEAETIRVTSVVRERASADVLDLQAGSNLRVGELEQQTEVLRAKIKAEAQAEARRLVAEKDAYVQNLRAQASLEIAKNKAETLRLQAEAERVAANKLKAKRDYEQKMMSLMVLRRLAENSQVVLSGKNNDNVVAQLVAAHHGSLALGLNGQ